MITRENPYDNVIFVGIEKFNQSVKRVRQFRVRGSGLRVAESGQFKLQDTDFQD
jgi:hypothetical protein